MNVYLLLLDNGVRMRTNEPFNFVCLLVAALIWIRFRFYPILIVVGVFATLHLWWRLTHPRVWKGNGYKVRVERGFRGLAWVHYEEAGRTLSFSAEGGQVEQKPHFSIKIEEKVYFPPDYENALSEPALQEIQRRIAERLGHLNIGSSFIRQGWTSY